MKNLAWFTFPEKVSSLCGSGTKRKVTLPLQRGHSLDPYLQTKEVWAFIFHIYPGLTFLILLQHGADSLRVGLLACVHASLSGAKATSGHICPL